MRNNSAVILALLVLHLIPGCCSSKPDQPDQPDQPDPPAPLAPQGPPDSPDRNDRQPTLDSLLRDRSDSCTKEFVTSAYTLVVCNDEDAQSLWIGSATSIPKQLMKEAYALSLKSAGDLDGDRIDECIVHSSCGGNGCPSDYDLAGTFSLTSGELKHITSSDGELEPFTLDGIPALEVSEPEGKTYYGLKNGKVEQISEKKARKLLAIAEVHGVEEYASEPGERILMTDVDLDGKMDTIRCTIWERWGSLLCTLPRPKAPPQQLNIGCHRFGAMALTLNGMRKFVCDVDTVIQFDGRSWVEAK